MFCPKCGAEIADDSKFCASCGNSIGGEKRSIEVPKISFNFDYDQILNFFLVSIKRPISATKELINELSDKVVLIYFFVAAVLTALIASITINSLFSRLIKSLVSLSGADATAYIQQVNEIKKSVLPFWKVFLWLLVGLLLLYLLIMLCGLLMNVIINKNNIHFTKYFVPASVGLTINLLGVAITFIISFISIKLAILIFVITAIAVMLTLYRGYGELIGENNMYVYIFSVVLVLSYLIASYVVSRMLLSHIVNLGLNSYLNPQNITSIFGL